MRFLYVAPRYHTNQIPIMKGLKEQGHTVAFFSHYAGKIEDYSYIKPEIIGYSWLFQLFDFFYVKVLHKNNPKVADKKLLRGFPSVYKLSRKIKEFNPDLVIIRERSVYSMVTYAVCRYRRIPSILYNQSPVYGEVKNDAAHKLVKKLTPKVRMTPVMGTETEKNVKEPGTFFVPFVMEPMVAPEEKRYCVNHQIHIFTVGKYEKRKNLLMMAEIIKQLAEKCDVYLTIAGECSTEFHKEYYSKLSEYIESSRLQDRIVLLKNLSREEMNKEYEKTDLFVLPSTLEPASISQLEAMAFSVPVICSDTNGSACYVKNNHNGFLFKDNDKESLSKAIVKIIDNQKTIVRMGRNSYTDIKEKYQFENYYAGIRECIHYLQK